MKTAATYRLTVLASIFSSFMAGLHVPVLHEIVEHGAAPRWDVLGATVVLVIGTVVGTWTLLRR